MTKTQKRNITKVLKNIYIYLVFLFLYLPILYVIIFSFNTSKLNIVFESFTLQWYGSFFKNRTLMDALMNTLIVGILSTVFSTIIGTIGAIGLSKYRFKGRGIIDKLLYIPIVIPEVVLGVALLSIYSILSVPLGLLSLVISHITFSIPFVVITVRARLAGFDKYLEEAAMDLGANRIVTFWKVALPLIMPGVLSGAMLAFSLSIDDVVISFFTTGPGSTTLPLKIFSMVKTGVTPEVNALSTVIMLVTIVIIVINTWFQVKKLKAVKA
ncbi:spermidine/putrescine transport system permease protein [Clostridium saccharoperbutylacetonicum]|uniref:Spermidine/putrescine transport system permease protein PotC n=1 Tax=Clostridium saccharoperbutylacetonicum N1-4(HMT) TaxID=931276 RepID=M1MFG9_9CLOT|nr:ABC transporter permease subunit [Clostridium saccharoperbutylacetonicum]AGF56659.1 spermidine/putrescine transport system permease protein PotC [Clostridium saccharoperbutylacetonicum N1-4(HMT)]NRT62587.1 spermidine/putrescine transport system permease protein [Clostridium saccharoperbutylacetonicum]NSB25935.1 spermidine/putrescine transport system permease protein [Clostridium saccharoperbutylacetonicum]NSB45293.1 spermidine/putrescine transport system permease protein [Clostridium sacchar